MANPMMVLGDVSEAPNFPGVDLSGLPSISEIRERDRIRVLINSYTPGLANRASKDEPVVGFEIDLIRSVTQSVFGGTSDIDSHLELIEVDNNVKIDFLADNQVDLIVANLFDTPERRKSIDFAGHYISARYSPIVGDSQDDIVDISDLRGLRIAVDAGSEDERTLARLAPEAEVVPMEGPETWLNALTDNTVNAFWGDTVVDSHYARNSGGKIRQCTLKTGIGHSAIGVNKQKADLRHYLNDFIAHMLSSGQLSTALRRWGL